MMNERLNSLLSEVGESFDYLKSDVRNLGRYLAELERLIEDYRAFAVTVTLSTSAERQAQRKLLTRTQKIIGLPLDMPEEKDQEAGQAAGSSEMQGERLASPGKR